MKKPPRLTLIDLMATIGAAALALGLLRWAAPVHAGLGLMIVGPLVGIVWQRSLGGRGIVGGTVGGGAYAALGLLDFATGPHGPGRPGPSSMADWPKQVVIMATGCVAFGLVMG